MNVSTIDVKKHERQNFAAAIVPILLEYNIINTNKRHALTGLESTANLCTSRLKTCSLL